MKKKPRAKRNRRRVISVRTAAGGTATLATLGLTTCEQGGVVDPLPPPPLVCADARHGQNLGATGTLDDSVLTVHVYSFEFYGGVDTTYVTDVTGATLDSMLVGANFFQLAFTLDSLTTTQVTFTLRGTFRLDAGPCDFSRQFTVTINGTDVEVAWVRRELPFGAGRDALRIELVERSGRRVRLRPAGLTTEVPIWKVTGGAMEPSEGGSIVWELPIENGFYQVELLVDRGEEGFGFDSLSFEVV